MQGVGGPSLVLQHRAVPSSSLPLSDSGWDVRASLFSTELSSVPSASPTGTKTMLLPGTRRSRLSCTVVSSFVFDRVVQDHVQIRVLTSNTGVCCAHS